MTDVLAPQAATFDHWENIKLVVWDLDDTFWTGTLSEEGAQLVDRNVEIVKELACRGIVSSIASKNEYNSVKQKLEEFGVWDYFVFPQVSWNSKGAALETIIEQANLRQNNILFIDDNSLNLEEARFRFPSMMVAHPDEILHTLLGLRQAAGKHDKALSRLNQYKQLEKKVSERAANNLSNEEFLRQCNIRLRFDYDIEAHFDRVVELANRSNQLNYTKIRIETSGALDEFRAQLKRHDIMAAAIFASDRYGDHGLIGFYMQKKDERQNRLIHYVWSCRMMNAGLEQYVYERLGSPEIDIVDPVSNPVSTFDAVDWISEGSGDSTAATAAAHRLLLLGSCDLSAVASYCSSNRVEYVNSVKKGVMTRSDDFGFILNDPEDVRLSSALPHIPAWEAAEFASFHRELPESDVVIVSLSAALRGTYLKTGDNVVVRLHPNGLGEHIDAYPWAGFLDGCSFFTLNLDQRMELLRQSFDYVSRCVKSSARIFVLGANTRDDGRPLTASDRDLMTPYNMVCEEICKQFGWDFVSIDEVVPASDLVDDRHYTRIGYFAIASEINSRLSDQATAPRSQRPVAGEPFDLPSFVSRGKRVTRFSVFGPERANQGLVKTVRRGVNRSLKRLLTGKRDGLAISGTTS